MSNGDLSAFFGNGFDPNSVEPIGDFDFIPAGDYQVLIEKAEVKANKKNTGHYIEIAMSVLDGKFKNRKLWFRPNIDNPSEIAVEISMRTLAALGQSIGVASITDTSQLLNKACTACVKVKDNYNEIRTFKPLPGTQSALVQAAPLVQQPVQQFAPPPAYPTAAGPNAPFDPGQQAVQPQAPVQQVQYVDAAGNPAPAPMQQPAPVQSQAQQPAPVQQQAPVRQQQAPPWKRSPADAIPF